MISERQPGQDLPRCLNTHPPSWMPWVKTTQPQAVNLRPWVNALIPSRSLYLQMQGVWPNLTGKHVGGEVPPSNG